MATIPQRELRNNVSQVLRRAQDGERLTVTVDGRPVAELGPLTGPSRFAVPRRLAEILNETAVDPSWREDLRRMRHEDVAAASERWSD